MPGYIKHDRRLWKWLGLLVLASTHCISFQPSLAINNSMAYWGHVRPENQTLPNLALLHYFMSNANWSFTKEISKVNANRWNSNTDPHSKSKYKLVDQITPSTKYEVSWANPSSQLVKKDIVLNELIKHLSISDWRYVPILKGFLN